MGYEGLGIGVGELKLGIPYLREMKAFAGFPLLCLNLYEGGARVLDQDAKLGSSSYVVTSLLPAGPLVEDGITIKPPLAELKAWWDALDPKVVPIVLWGGTEQELLALVKDFPEAKDRGWFVCGGSPDQPVVLKEAQPTRAFSVGSKGRFVALLSPDESRYLSDFRLEESIEFHPDVNPILEAYRDALKTENLLAAVPRKPMDLEYVGDKSCRECHEPTCNFLDTSSHKRAWATLVETNDHFDPECVSCHVTGYGETSGFLSFEKTPELVNVTCESCHGPGELHVNTQAPMPVKHPKQSLCIVCHDADNSPQFRYEKYWPQIAHPPSESGK
jgi:hypothetical protein